MLGLLVIIVVSWALLRLIEKKNITVLGIIPNKIWILQFLIGFIFIALLGLSMIYIDSIVKSVDWQLKPMISIRTIFEAFIYHLKSALTEDLVFRGAILYLLINKIGAKKAIIISP